MEFSVGHEEQERQEEVSQEQDDKQMDESIQEEASTSEGQEEEVQAESSAETENTDDKPKTVPYDRFSEVNKKMRDYEQEIKNLKNNYSVYFELDEAMKKDETLNEMVNDVWTKYHNGELTKKQAEKQVDKAVDQHQAREENKNPVYDEILEGTRSIIESNYAAEYATEFKSYFDTEEYSNDEKKKLDEIFGSAVKGVLPSEQYKKYNRGIVKDAFKNIKGVLDDYAKIINKERAVKKKTVPPSGDGQIVKTAPKYNSDEARRKAIQEHLEKGGKIF